MSEPAHDTVFTISVEGIPRHFRVHSPPAARADPRALFPAVVMLHGAGGTALWTLEETGWAVTADRNGFFLILPEGMRPDLTRPPGFLQNPQVWNDGSARTPANLSQADDVAFIDAVVSNALHRFPIDPDRIYVTGFSNGAGMTFRLGAELSERFAALAPVSGHCAIADPHPTRPLPTLYMVGDRDPLIPLEGGQILSPWGRVTVQKPPVRDTLARWAKALKCAVSPRLIQNENGIREELFEPQPGGAELRVITIAGLGHHWPGGRGQLTKRLAGPPSDRVRANDVIWDFFRNQRRSRNA